MEEKCIYKEKKAVINCHVRTEYNTSTSLREAFSLKYHVKKKSGKANKQNEKMNLASHIRVSAPLLSSSSVPFPYERQPSLCLLFWLPKAWFLFSMVFEKPLDRRGRTYQRGKGDHLASASNQWCTAMPSGRAAIGRQEQVMEATSDGRRFPRGSQGVVTWSLL